MNEHFTRKRKVAFREDLISRIWAKFAKISPRENLYTVTQL